MDGSQALLDLEKRRCVAIGAADDITVRQFGDTAILIGEQINKSGGEPSVGVATQIVHRSDGRWRFVSMQLTRKS